MVALAACGGGGEAAAPTADAPAAVECAAVEAVVPEPAAVEAVVTEAVVTEAVVTEAVVTDGASDEAGAGECEEYFRFCVTSTVSGAVNAEAAAGVGANIDTCAAWAAAGDARIVELPMMLAAGDAPITVALTRVGAYTGPGQYALQPSVTQGMPDMFPTLDVGGRTFTNGEGSTAVVTVNADGSGSVEATGLVEIASIQVSEPDPSARIDFSMQWTCQDS
jgi:hypothetical protein